jgi:Paraquat-inducible protein B
VTKIRIPPAKILDGRRYSPVWLVPIAAVLFGVWIIFTQFAERGTEITIQFATAEGIEAGKTKVLTRNVQVGTVVDIKLNDDLESVSVVALIDEDAGDLLTRDASLWVVKPRFDAGGVSGLGTVLSGAYIELRPGTDQDRSDEFQGLENAPVSASNKPGVRISLHSVDQPILQVGQPVRFRGMIVGKIETMNFDPKTRNVVYSAHIDAPYDRLIAGHTRFWRVDAVDFNTSTEGVRLSIATLDSLFSGGISFDLTQEASRDGNDSAKESYTIHRNAAEALEPQFEQAAEFVVLVQSSVRGLREGAPVLFRGLKIGTVKTAEEFQSQRISLTREQSIPVTIAIEPGRLGLGDTASGVQTVRAEIDRGLRQGLVARVESGNLITGRSMITLDFVGGAKVAKKAWRSARDPSRARRHRATSRSCKCTVGEVGEPAT